jgi:hypothetical protein
VSVRTALVVVAVIAAGLPVDAEASEDVAGKAAAAAAATPAAHPNPTANPITNATANPTATAASAAAGNFVLATFTPPALPAPPTVSTPPAPGPEDGEPTSHEGPRLMHGELSHLGERELWTTKSRVGARVGYQRSDGYDYMVVTPGFDMRGHKFQMGMAAPLRLELCRGDIPPGGCIDVDKRTLKPDPNRWRLERSDWRSVEDFVSAFRYLSWGEKEDRFHAELSQLEPATLGHGALLRRYFANGAPESRRLAAQVDLAGDHGGFEAYANGLLHSSLVAVRGHLRPLSWGAEEELARTITVGVTWARDLGAPAAPRAGVDPAGVARPEDAFEKRPITALSIDAELVALRTGSWELAPYAELASLGGAGSGFATGFMARGAVGDLLGLRFLVEGRSFQPNYQPGYFDELYEVEKVQYQLGPTGPVTKWQAVSSRTGARRVGWNLEGTAALGRALVLSAGLEGASAPATRNAYLHAEVPVLEWLRFFATLHRRSFEGESLLGDGALGRPTTLLFSGARLKLLPFLFVNGTATQSYAWDAALGRYRNARSYDADVELAVEF